MAQSKAKPTPPASKGAIATRPDPQMALAQSVGGFTPPTVADAWKMAKMLAQSGLVPTALRDKPSDVLVVLMTGRELGLPPMTSLRSLHVIEGRVQMAAEMMVARCKARPDICRYFQMIESTLDHAVYETLRAGAPKPTRYEYTIRDAMAAQLLGKSNWKSSPRAMLRARASSGLARIEYPDLVAGLIIEDEIEEVQMTSERMAGAMAGTVEDTLARRIQEGEAVDVVDVGPGQEIDEGEGVAPPAPEVDLTTPAPTVPIRPSEVSIPVDDAGETLI